MKLPKLIVFDMDGVLIDVSGSYRETVRAAARLFFRGARGFDKLPDPLFPLDDLARLKQTGGLNNDWDLTAQVISLLFALVGPSNYLPTANRSADEGVMRGYDVADLADFLVRSQGPLMELLARYGRRSEPFVTDRFQGDVGSGNVIKQIFQEIYLGRSLFWEIYGLAPQFSPGEGLIERERLLIDKPMLETLAKRHILAIATGRPRVEAERPLDRFAIRDLFQLMITHDDCVREERRFVEEGGRQVSLAKPNPFMLDTIARLVGEPFEGSYYLGDMPDDMTAARSSLTGYQGVGVVSSSSDRETLKGQLLRAGASHIIEDFSELPGIIG